MQWLEVQWYLMRYEEKVALKGIFCAIQLDWLVMIKVDGRVVTRDVNMFGVKPKWTRCVQMWEETNIITVRRTQRPVMMT